MNFLCLQKNAVERRISSGWRTQFFYFDIYHCGFELFYSKKIVFKKLSAINQLHSYLGLITLLLIDMIILFLHYIMTVCEGQNSFLIEISETLRHVLCDSKRVLTLLCNEYGAHTWICTCDRMSVMDLVPPSFTWSIPWESSETHLSHCHPSPYIAINTSSKILMQGTDLSAEMMELL